MTIEGEPVSLYVYDLSNGLALTMGRALTGRDVEGIWCVFQSRTFVIQQRPCGSGALLTSSATMKAHFARAVRYGGVFRPRNLDRHAARHDSRQSTLCTDSFKSRKLIALASLQHGVPKKKLSCGVTHLDKETFLEYIENLRETYRAEAYHLLEFNCEPHVFLSPTLMYDANARMSRQATPLRTTCSVSLTAARFRQVRFQICSEPAGSARLSSSSVHHRHPKSANRAHVNAVRPADATDD